MLKTFNVVDKYSEILGYLDSKKNQSSFICEIILKEMQGEQLEQDMDKIKNQLIEEVRAEVREVIRSELRTEHRTEHRIDRSELKQMLEEWLGAYEEKQLKFFQEMMDQSLEQSKKTGHYTGQGIKKDLRATQETAPMTSTLKSVPLSY